MTKSESSAAIRLRGVRHNNLKNFDLDIPIEKLTVITGLSGSGKSSLAFDTLFAEGQRRYIETFSPYARQFFDRMDKPKVDRIEGIPPAIAIEQRNSVRSTRSTVGTMTELCDYMKLLWLHLAQLHCRQCGQPVRPESPQLVWAELNRQASGPSTPSETLITFELPLADKLSLKESLALIGRQGYQRLLVGHEIVRLDDALSRLAPRTSRLVVVQDRLKLAEASRARFVEACEQAYHFGKGKLAIHFVDSAAANSKPESRIPKLFSSGFHCARCDLDYREPSSALFSFNHPVGACASCKGFGRIISIDYDLAIPDRLKSLAGGAVKPWQTGTGAECQADLARVCRKHKVPMDVPFAELSEPHQRWVIDGDEGYDSSDPDRSWPRLWYGVKGYFRWLESKSYKMHVRVLLSRYRAYTTCPDCQGRRLKPESLLYLLKIVREPALRTQNSASSGAAAPRHADSLNIHSRNAEYSLTLADFYALPVERALALIETIAAQCVVKPNDPLSLVLNEVRSRLCYLAEVGLGYLTLDRPTRTLSGGETERVKLTACLGTGLVNTLFVLDEPSVGLHPRDTVRLVRILEQLRDAGNTVVVVEHEASVMRAADQIVDLGPGQGEKGGEVVFCGPVKNLLTSDHSLTGQYLSGRKQIEIPRRRPVKGGSASRRYRVTNDAAFSSRALALNEAVLPYGGRREACPALKISNATRHNLKNLSVEIPLGRFVALTGVSGSGKTTLVREVLLPALRTRLTSNASVMKACDRLDDDEETGDDPSSISNSRFTLSGWESLNQVILVDQSALGKTPRSNPVVYIGAFDDVRELFAQTDLAKQRGLNGSAFSFNSSVGQCERCRGAGFEKIEMQFLSDIFIRCAECRGRRYRAHILDVKLRGARTKKVFNNQSSDFSAKAGRRANRPPNTDSPGTEDWSIADLLEATVDDTLEFLMSFTHLPAGRRALARLKLLQDVGLGYLRLGQPINTLSGGESQRLKLVSHLAESAAASKPTATDIDRLSPRNTREQVKKWLAERNAASGLKACSAAPPLTGSADDNNQRLLTSSAARGTLFLFDEPTTGLHFDDVRVLLQVFQRLVDAGHSVLVIEHNLDVIKCADWLIDLGPEAGEHGGQLVACGTPEEVAAAESSHTGRFLYEILSAPGDFSIAAGTSSSGTVANDGVSPDSASGRISVRPCRTLPSE